MRGLHFHRKLDFLLGIPLICVLGALWPKRKRLPDEVRTIGLLHTAGLGDTLLLSPMLSALKKRFPDAKVIFYCSPGNKGAIELLPHIDEISVIPNFTHILRTCWQLRKARLDIIIDLLPWPRISALYCLLSRANYRVGFDTQGQYRKRAYDLAVPHKPDLHEMENQLAIAQALGATAELKPELILSKATIKKLLPKKPFMVFHPWASGSGTMEKRWPVQHWKALYDWAVSRGYHILITGGPSDVELSEMLVAELGAEASHLAGKSSLLETAHILKEAACVFSVSTGTMHLAAGLGCPTIGLLGPINETRWRPIGPNAFTVSPEMEGCGYISLGFEYPANPPACMAAIAPQKVIEAAENLLQAKPPKRTKRKS